MHKPSSPTEPTVSDSAPQVPRRNLLTALSALVVSAVTAVVPVVSGILFFLDPVRRRSGTAADASAEGFIKVAMRDALPADGTPQRFAVRRDRRDAWNRFPNEPVGAVYLRRVGDQVIAFNVVRPHLGCSVDYRADAAGGGFFCPCHTSTFAIDGQPLNQIPPRGLDTLEVDEQRLAQGEVWVRFQNFYTGRHDKVPRG